MLGVCSKINFGSVDLSTGEREFYEGFNREIISLCDSLPESVQFDALLFFMSYSGLTIGYKYDFFKNYYVPSWSILYWLIHFDGENGRLTKEDIKNSKTAHSMAMKLHSLDDHICDKEIPVSHLTLLLRSQAWMIMNNAFSGLAEGIDGGQDIVQRSINDYYFSIRDPGEIESLDRFCNVFRKQMATWLIVPALISKKLMADKDFIDAIQTAYGSFGIAWKLLDDIMDLELDMKNSAHSSVYICLPDNMKKLWNENEMTASNDDRCRCDTILNCIHQNGLINMIKNRISGELKLAVVLFEKHQMTGFAGELRSLLKPLND